MILFMVKAKYYNQMNENEKHISHLDVYINCQVSVITTLKYLKT